MKLNHKYLYLTVVLFITELLIALYIRDQFVRPILGDALVVMLIFSFIRIFSKIHVNELAIYVLLFSFSIEIAQYFRLVSILGLEENKIATTILGATFDWIDLVAYTIGVGVSVILDKKFFKSQC